MATKAKKAEPLDAGEFHKFVDDIEDLIKETTTLTGEELSRALDKLRERVAMAKLSTSVMGGMIAGQATRAVEATDDYVHEQPWAAVGVGAALGLVVGLLLARR